MSLRSDLAKFRALPSAQQRLLVLALVLLPVHAAGLRWFGLRRVQGWFRPPRSMPHCTPARAAHLVSVAARRGPFRAGCLPTALTLQRILEAQGVSAELRLGVRKVGERLEAHAWLEHRGAVLIDTSDPHEGFLAFERAIAFSPGPPR